MWRSLAVAITYQDRKELLSLDRTETEKKAILAVWKAITRPNSKSQLTVALRLQQSTNTTAGTFDDLITISNHIERNISVVNFDEEKFIEFRTADQREHAFKKTLYLLRRDQHYDPINSITGFFGRAYYCDPCNIQSNRKYAHRCPHQCRSCYRDMKDHVDPYPSYTRCDQCYRVFKDKECYTIHVKAVCKVSWR